mgnify:CR=1 FL=1
MSKSWILNWVKESDQVTDLYIYDYISHEKSYDWERGKPGPEVTAQEIIDQLAAVPTQEIVVHINSGGGDATEGVAIAQALKDARGKGKRISCQVDGLCASAAVNVALACSPVRIPRSAYMMIHDPACVQVGLFTASEMRKSADQLDAVKRGIVAGYAERTGLSNREIARMMAAETWMTGEEAVAAHFADELLEEPVTIQRDFSTQNLMLNGHMVNIAPFDHIPEPLEAARPFEKEENILEIKNLEELKAAYPELCGQLENAARQEGQAQERQRLQAIDEVAGIVGEELVNAAKYTQPTDAKELLFQAAKDGQLVNRAGAAVLAGFEKDAQVVNQVGSFANGGVAQSASPEQAKKAEAEAAAAKAFGNMKK